MTSTVRRTAWKIRCAAAAALCALLVTGCDWMLGRSCVLSIEIEGEGTVTPDGGVFERDSSVTVTAAPAFGWRFVRWEGDVEGSTLELELTMKRNRSLTAVFEEHPVAPERSWNFLVYMSADNDLEGFGLADINEMERVGSTDEVNVLVLFDRSPSLQGELDLVNGLWAGTKLFRIVKDAAGSNGIVSELVHDYGELEMGDPETLSDFIRFCDLYFPAEKTALVLWNHGSGVFPRSLEGVSAGGQDSRAIAYDFSTNPVNPEDPWSALMTDEVRTALAAARPAGPRLEVIDMDACMMQTVEVAYEWSEEAEYLAGSQENVPGNGNDYEAVLEYLTADPGTDGEAFAREFVDLYHTEYDPYYGLDTTYSAISLAALRDGADGGFMSAFSDFSAELQTAAAESSSSLSFGPGEVRPIDEIILSWWRSTSFDFFDYEYVDIVSFIDWVIEYCGASELAAAASALRGTILDESGSGLVVHHLETGLYAGTEYPAYGVSVLFPSPEAWQNYNDTIWTQRNGEDQYEALRFPAATGWAAFIREFTEFFTPDTGKLENTSWSLSPEGAGADVTVTFNDNFVLEFGGYSGSWSMIGNAMAGLYSDGFGTVHDLYGVLSADGEALIHVTVSGSSFTAVKQ